MAPTRAGKPKPAPLKRKKAEQDSESEGDVHDDDSYNQSPSSGKDDGDFAKALDSDALDDDEIPTKESKKIKRSPTKKKAPPRKAPPKKRTKKVHSSDESEDDDLELQEGLEVVGTIVQAPTSGRVPPGQISQNTFNFLSQLRNPECNDREWFKLNESVYRLAEKEWKDFIEVFTTLIVEADPQIPPLPPKDVIHRIYRDIRFSNDKTPYKTNLSASFSRSGRKGIFAGYHVAVSPGGGSMIAAGTWCPGKNELQTIRNNIQRSPTRLRRIISSPQFVKHFGQAKPHPKGERRNIFGAEDELKVAPKGVDKTHPDIDLLKCRSFAVVHRFVDEVALKPDFKEKLKEMVEVIQPFVHCLNDMMTISDARSDSSQDEDENLDEEE